MQEPDIGIYFGGGRKKRIVGKCRAGLLEKRNGLIHAMQFHQDSGNIGLHRRAGKGFPAWFQRLQGAFVAGQGGRILIAAIVQRAQINQHFGGIRIFAMRPQFGFKATRQRNRVVIASKPVQRINAPDLRLRGQARVSRLHGAGRRRFQSDAGRRMISLNAQALPDKPPRLRAAVSIPVPFRENSSKTRPLNGVARILAHTTARGFEQIGQAFGLSGGFPQQCLAFRRFRFRRFGRGEKALAQDFQCF